jgi:hypothetical protein
MDPAALKFLLDEIGRLFDEQNAKWDARFSQWNAKREPEPYLGDEVEAEEVAASDLREARDLEREEVEHAKLHEDRSQGAADAGREVALAARLLAADACAARIVDVVAPFDSYVPAYAAQFDGFNLDHAAFLGNGANSGLMGSAFFKEREEAHRCMPSQDKLVIDLDPPDNIETSLSESAFHDVPGANYMEALTTCSTPGLTERAMDELIRMAQAGERLWVNTGGREVLHVDTYDSIFAKPGDSFLGPDVHVDTWFGAPTSRSGRLPSECLIADMADGSSKVIWVELEIEDRVSIHLLWSGPDRGVSGTFDADVTADFLRAQELDIMCRAHQVVEDGYKYFPDHQFVTFFTAPNYRQLGCSFTIFKLKIDRSSSSPLGCSTRGPSQALHPIVKLNTIGGQRDVWGSLPVTLAACGHCVMVAMVMEPCARGKLFDRIIGKGYYTERVTAISCRAAVNVQQRFLWDPGVVVRSGSVVAFGSKLRHTCVDGRTMHCYDCELLTGETLESWRTHSARQQPRKEYLEIPCAELWCMAEPSVLHYDEQKSGLVQRVVDELVVCFGSSASMQTVKLSMVKTYLREKNEGLS